MCVFKPRSENNEANSKRCVLSVEELTDLDELNASLRVMQLLMHLVLFYTKAILEFRHR